MTIEMKSFAISTLDDIAEGFFHARISDLPESKPCWQEIRKIRLSAAERSGRQQAANAAKQSPAEKAEKEGGLLRISLNNIKSPESCINTGFFELFIFQR